MHLAPLIHDLAVILGVAAVVTLIFRRIRQPVVLGYIVVLERNGRAIVAPSPTLLLFPGDKLLCFGAEADISQVVQMLETPCPELGAAADLGTYALRLVELAAGGPLDGVRLRESKIRQHHDCIVVGVERDLVRIANPSPDFALAGGDGLWVVGETHKIEEFARTVGPHRSTTAEAVVVGG